MPAFLHLFPLLARPRFTRIGVALAALGMLAGACSDSPVQPPAVATVATVTVSPATGSALVGGTVSLTAVVKDASGTTLTDRQVTWSSAQPSIASVAAGSGLASTATVTAVAGGTATITATAGGKTGSAVITVTVPVVPVATVTIAPTTQPMERTLTQQLVATTKDAAGNTLTGRTVTWSSSAPAIVSVDANTGLMTVLDRGRATITATSETKTGTTAVEGIILYRSISGGDSFNCDLGSIGIATCWGNNGGQDGRLGNGALDNASLPDSPVPVVVLGGQRFTTIAAGARHTCGLTSTGAAFCWGSNGDGQLGAPSVPSWAHQPVPVAGGLTFTSITAGAGHTCAIQTTTKAAYCWGINGEGQLGNGTRVASNVPVAVSGGIAFRQLSASQGVNNTTCGIADDGRAFCWGSDTYGMIGDGGPMSGLTTDIRQTPTLVSGGHSWKSIAVGYFHVCGVRSDDVGMCWGDNGSGKLGMGDASPNATVPVVLNTPARFSQIETGYYHTCGVTTAFALYCWGANVSGESGTALAIGDTGYSPAQAAPGEWSEVNLGGTSAGTCMITRDRLSVRCMGRNDLGQLGNGTTTGANVPNATPVLVSGQQPLP
jgi:alpha-tubulin suppressor-like RCC1 family protein